MDMKSVSFICKEGRVKGLRFRALAHLDNVEDKNLIASPHILSLLDHNLKIYTSYLGNVRKY